MIKLNVVTQLLESIYAVEILELMMQGKPMGLKYFSIITHQKLR